MLHVQVIKDRMNNFDAKRAGALLDDVTSNDGGSDDVLRSRKVRLAFLDMLLYMADNGRKLSFDDIQEEVDTFMFEVSILNE